MKTKEVEKIFNKYCSLILREYSEYIIKDKKGFIKALSQSEAQPEQPDINTSFFGNTGARIPVQPKQTAERPDLECDDSEFLNDLAEEEAKQLAKIFWNNYPKDKLYNSQTITTPNCWELMAQFAIKYAQFQQQEKPNTCVDCDKEKETHSICTECLNKLIKHNQPKKIFQTSEEYYRNR